MNYYDQTWSSAPATHDLHDDDDLDARLEQAAVNKKVNKKCGRKVQRKLNMHVYEKAACEYVEQTLDLTYLDDEPPSRGMCASLRKPKDCVNFNDISKVSLFDSKDYIGVRGFPTLRSLKGEPGKGWRERSRERVRLKKRAEGLSSGKEVEKGTP